MLYLSQILGAKIRDSSDQVIGKLKDVLIKPTPGVYAPLEAFLIKDYRSRKLSYLPFHYVENLSHDEVTLKTLAEKIIPYVPVIGDIFLLRDVMDQQIVDTAGARVIRVNDLQIGTVEGEMCILGIDVSTRGLLRRLGLTKFRIFNCFKTKLIDWKSAQPVKGILKLESLSKDLVRLHPADLANIIENLNVSQGSQLVQALGAETAAKILEETNPRVRQILLRALGPERTAKISERMSIDELVDLIKLLPYHEAREIYSFSQNGRLKEVRKLLPYKDDTAGGLMTTEFINARPDWLVKEAIEEIKKKSESFRSILYVYVTDADGAYRGAVSLRRLLTVKPEVILSEVMKKAKHLPCAKVHQSVEEVAKMMTKYNLYSAAVVDHRHHLLGVIHVDDIMRRLLPHA